MTLSVIIGLAIQGTAVWIMHVGIRGRWLSHVGAIFLAIAVGYHGLTEILQWVFPGSRNSYRKFVFQSQIDNWIVIASVALLLYTAAYVFVIRRARPMDTTRYFGGINPIWLIAAIAPLVTLTVAGSAVTAYRTPEIRETSSEYLLGGLTQQFIVLVVGLAGASLVVKRGPHWLLPTLVAESAMLSLGGERRSVIFLCIITLYGLQLAGVKLPRKSLAIGIVTAAVLVLAVSASRDVVGRDDFGEGQGAEQRTNALVVGGSALGSSTGWSGVKDETVYRLDGNTFGAMMDTRLRDGVPAVGIATVWNTLKLSVPSFLYPQKIYQPIQARDEETYLIYHFSIGYFDYIPGVLGTVISYQGRWALIVIASLLGAGFAGIDRVVRHRQTPARLAFGSGMVLGVLLYEQGPTGLIISARGALALAAIIWLTPMLVKTFRGQPLMISGPAR